MKKCDCFADISTREERTVTQKLDLDQMSEMTEYTHTERHKYHNTHFLLQILGLFTSYDPDWTILVLFAT